MIEGKETSREELKDEKSRKKESKMESHGRYVKRKEGKQGQEKGTGKARKERSERK